MGETFRIGQVTAETGLTAKAIRLYEGRGLLQATSRSAAGYRMFTRDDIEILIFIRRARMLGLRLNEIADFLDAHRAGTPPCPRVRSALDRHITEIDTTIAELRELRATLATARTADDSPAPATQVCPIIEQGAYGQTPWRSP